MAENNDKPSVGLISVLASAFAALIGVQKDKNRVRDFESGKFWHFFVAGAIVTLLFLAGVWLWVKTVLSEA